MKPGISRTGRPSPSRTPPPRQTELRNSAAASTPARAFAPERGEVRERDAHVHFVPNCADRDDHRRTGSTLAAMRAATIVDGRIEVADHPDPEPQDGQLLVRVRAAGLNGADMLQVAGHYPRAAGRARRTSRASSSPARSSPAAAASAASSPATA